MSLVANQQRRHTITNLENMRNLQTDVTNLKLIIIIKCFY